MLRDPEVRLHLNTWGHHSWCCCSSRAFAIFADFARTAVRAAASEQSESQLVRAKHAKHAKRREEQRNDGNGNRADGRGRGEPSMLLWLFFGAGRSRAPPRKRPTCSASSFKSRPDQRTPFPRKINHSYRSNPRTLGRHWVNTTALRSLRLCGHRVIGSSLSAHSVRGSSLSRRYGRVSTSTLGTRSRCPTWTSLSN